MGPYPPLFGLPVLSASPVLRRQESMNDFRADVSLSPHLLALQCVSAETIQTGLLVTAPVLVSDCNQEDNILYFTLSSWQLLSL